jgi:hypothetical protein
MSFPLDMPSQIKFEMPNWYGDVMTYGGGIEKKAEVFFGDVGSFAKGVLSAVNPVGKAVGTISEGTSELLKGTGQAASAAVGGISSGFKWAVIIVIVGVALYAFALISPLIPRPAR